ncbi:MAG: hypothetical protein ACOYIK_00695 [Coriobacteriales bacterium]
MITGNTNIYDGIWGWNRDPEILRARMLIENAQCVLVRLGSGFDLACGIDFHKADMRFLDYFGDFHRNYGISSISQGITFPYVTDETHWAFASRLAMMLHYDSEPARPVRLLHNILHGKDSYVITSSIAGQLQEAGFDHLRMFETHGNVMGMQCVEGCHDTVYDVEELVRKMSEEQDDCFVPEELVPHCPNCGAGMRLHIEGPHYVGGMEEKARHREFVHFLDRAREGGLVELRLGVNELEYDSKAAILMSEVPEKDASVISVGEDVSLDPPVRCDVYVPVRSNIVVALHQLLP